MKPTTPDPIDMVFYRRTGCGLALRGVGVSVPLVTEVSQRILSDRINADAHDYACTGDLAWLKGHDTEWKKAARCRYSWY